MNNNENQKSRTRAKFLWKFTFNFIHSLQSAANIQSGDLIVSCLSSYLTTTTGTTSVYWAEVVLYSRPLLLLEAPLLPRRFPLSIFDLLGEFSALVIAEL